MLKISGVQECYVYCTSFAQDIKAYLNEWTEDQGANVMTINVIINEECRSFGDAMRDLDGKGVLRQDFILIFGDCVGNADLSNVLQLHKARAKEDKNATMTLVYREAAPGHHLRTIQNEVFLAVNEEQRILHHTRPGLEQNFKVPLEVFEDNPVVDLKFDMLDLGIAICTQAVPPLFADNFDCQTLDQFIIGVLQDDLTDNTLHLHVLGNDTYAAKITDLHSYMGVQNDLLHRWLYPVVPEIASGMTPTDFVYNRHNIYKGPSIDLKKGCILEQDVLVASGACVGERSTLSNAIIGKNTTIGKDVSLRNCVVGNGVTIGNGCQLLGCVLGDKVNIGNNVVIEEKCVLGDKVEIGNDIKLPRETWLVSEKPKSGFSDDESDDEDGLYGPRGIVYKDEDEDEDDSDDEKEGIEAKWGGVITEFLNADEDSEDEDEDNDLDELEDAIHNFEIDDDAKYKVFHGEVYESLLRGAKEGVKVDNLVLEVNSSRHAYAVTQTQVIQSVLTSILEIASSQSDTSSSAKLLSEVKKCIVQFTQLVLKYVKTNQAQVDCLAALESFVGQEADFLQIIAKVVHVLYDQDILSDEAIFKWFAKLASSSQIKEKMKPLIEWLEEDEDSESE